jgi:hypothetical protein
LEFGHLARQGDWNGAHEVLWDKLAPLWILSDEGMLKRQLDKLAPHWKSIT